MYSKISSMLDKVANSLESIGLLKEAYELDKIADEFESVHNIDDGKTYKLSSMSLISSVSPGDPLYPIAAALMAHIIGPKSQDPEELKRLKEDFQDTILEASKDIKEKRDRDEFTVEAVKEIIEKYELNTMPKGPRAIENIYRNINKIT